MLPAAPRPWNWRPGSFVRKIPPPRTCASGSYRRERSSPPPGANCPGCNPRARALSSCTGASVACRPLARIDSPGTGPRTCASGSMSTSEASVSPTGSVGPGRSPLGTRTQRRELPGVQPPRTCAILLHRRKRSLPPIGANCLGCNPRGRAPAVRTGVSAAHRPQARIARGATPAN